MDPLQTETLNMDPRYEVIKKDDLALLSASHRLLKALDLNPENLDPAVIVRLLEARHSLTTKGLAERTGLDRGWLSRFKKGLEFPGKKAIECFEEGFGSLFAQLLRDTTARKRAGD